MGLIEWLVSGLKGEIEWLITSLAVAPDAHENTASAADAGPAHLVASAPHDLDSIATVALPADSDIAANQAASRPADAFDAQSSAVTEPATAHSDATGQLLLANFIVDDSTQTESAPSLLQASSVPAAGEPIHVVTYASPPVSQDLQDLSGLYASTSGAHAAPQTPLPNSGAGDYSLASLDPQLRGDFAHGGGGTGGTSGGTKIPNYDTVINGHINNGLEIVIQFDTSVANAPKDATGNNLFVADVEKVANFFASNFTTATGTVTHPTMITIGAGYGEIEGSKLGNGVLGESDTWYATVSGSTNAQTQYSALQTPFNAIAAIEASHSSQVVNIPGSDPLGTAGQQWWVTTAEQKALGLAASNTSVDGYIGLAAGSTFFYGSTPVAKEYDFMGTVAHEISEVMGRVTLNGEKYPGYPLPEYMPLDLFHFADTGGAATFSGTTPGHFALSHGGSAIEEFNTNSSGDFSDWATGTSFPTDAFDWAGGAGSMSPVSYADYLAVEAAGWAGINPATAGNWTLFG